MAALGDTVREELLSRLEHFALAPRCVVVLGDAGARRLKRRFPRADVIEIVDRDAPAPRFAWWRPVRRLRTHGDILPIADAHADLLVARIGTLAPDHFEAHLGEMRRVLAPGGLLLLAASAADPQAIGSALAHAGFAEPVLDVERFPDDGTGAPAEPVVFGAAFGATPRATTSAGEVVVPISRLGRRPNSLS